VPCGEKECSCYVGNTHALCAQQTTLLLLWEHTYYVSVVALPSALVGPAALATGCGVAIPSAALVLWLRMKLGTTAVGGCTWDPKRRLAPISMLPRRWAGLMRDDNVRLMRGGHTAARTSSMDLDI